VKRHPTRLREKVKEERNIREEERRGERFWEAMTRKGTVMTENDEKRREEW
jgi:hypothetical protein